MRKREHSFATDLMLVLLLKTSFLLQNHCTLLFIMDFCLMNHLFIYFKFSYNYKHNNTYTRMLFDDFISPSNTVILSKLITKLSELGIDTFLCNWTLDFVTNRPQHVELNNTTSLSVTLNTGVPQGCVLSPFLYSLFTKSCRPVHGFNTITRFANHTTAFHCLVPMSNDKV